MDRVSAADLFKRIRAVHQTDDSSRFEVRSGKVAKSKKKIDVTKIYLNMIEGHAKVAQDLDQAKVQLNGFVRKDERWKKVVIKVAPGHECNETADELLSILKTRPAQVSFHQSKKEDRLSNSYLI